MEPMTLNEIETAPRAVVLAAGREFATALAETTQFKAFELAYDALRRDVTAQQALAAYQTKAESLRALLMLSAVSDDERAELEQLQQAYLTRASVQVYTGAEAELTTLCQQAAGMISAATGFNYAAACGASCCG